MDRGRPIETVCRFIPTVCVVIISGSGKENAIPIRPGCFISDNTFLRNPLPFTFLILFFQIIGSRDTPFPSEMDGSGIVLRIENGL